MKKVYTLLACSIALLSACTKNPVVAETPDPAPSSSFSRTITYAHQSTIKEATYDAAYKMKTEALVSDNTLLLHFNAAPRLAGTFGDAIAFHIDAAHIKTGLAKTYYLTANTTPAVLHTRYTYTFLNKDDGLWCSFTDSDTGVKFEGSLTIDKYDAARQLVSGQYKVEIKDLINDPTKNEIGIEAINQCTVTVTGTFANIKITH